MPVCDEEVCSKTRSTTGKSNTPPDLKVARLAAEQHGCVSLAQLAACGIDHDGARARVRTGRLHRIHRGVYAVGHDALTLHGRFMAAVLACGPTAVLSHRAAAALWGFLAWDEARHPEITVPGSAPLRAAIPACGPTAPATWTRATSAAARRSP